MLGALCYGKLGVLESLHITCMGRNSQLAMKFPNFIDSQPGKSGKTEDWRKWMDGMKHGEVVSDW